VERSKDDYLWSQKLRSKFRNEKKELKRSNEESAAKGFGFRLLELSAADQAAARAVSFAPKLSALKSSQLKRHAITSSIFPSSKPQSASLAAVEKAVRRGLTVRLPPSSLTSNPPD
jgi:predicted DNA-binding transcriptional regulator YafY